VSDSKDDELQCVIGVLISLKSLIARDKRKSIFLVDL